MTTGEVFESVVRTAGITNFAKRMHCRVLRVELKNFLSYKSATLSLDDFVALVGPNASGKSNAVAAIKLLREIPVYGLPIAIARRGGFEQLRHRSEGRPNDPSIRLVFRFPNTDDRESHYELSLGAVRGGQYKVKSEYIELHWADDLLTMSRAGVTVEWMEGSSSPEHRIQKFTVPENQTALSLAGFLGYVTSSVLQSLLTVEVNPSQVAQLQEPSSTAEFESDGSNIVSIVDDMNSSEKEEMITRLSAIVPGIEGVEVARLADRQTIRFLQRTDRGLRKFYAKQMSDGTLRAFTVLLALMQADSTSLLVVEEPEIEIHLGALRTLVEALDEASETLQILITTHSADIVDSLSINALRVVWSEEGESRISLVAEHTKGPVVDGLITPGQLLRSDALDPAEP